ncbi:MAG TPA: iron-containing alcohol dehydrogenase, partial [Bacillota bacterium]
MSAVDGYPAGEFVLPRSERVVYGVGCVQRLRAYVDALGGRRALLLTGRTLARQTELVDRLTALLGRACVGVFAETQAHVPVETVFAAAERARVDRADLLISFGGGSVIDTAKAVAAVLALGITSPEQLDPYFISVEEGSIRVPPIAGSVLPHLAIPTTLSAGEFTGTAGITDPERRRKFLLRDPKLTPRIVLLDPEVTLKTPLGLWTSTGIRALDHAVEAICGKQHNPITDALALAALEILFACLPASQAQPEALAPRGKAQLAAGMAIWAMSGAGSGLSHGIGYGLGARFGVPHGICS